MKNSKIKVHFFLLTFCCILPHFLYSQKEFTFSVSIYDKETKSPIPGVRINIHPLSKIILSDENGFSYYSLPYGEYDIDFHYIGYQKYKTSLFLDKNTNIEIELQPKTKDLEEVEVFADKKPTSSTISGGQITLEMKDIKTLPAFMGEVDIVKSIQLLPGVSSVNEGGQGFYVRGGGPDQNLVLIDDVPVYNASHLFGFFSVFNADAVSNATILKGSIPANFGGRLSSVLEIKCNDGSRSRIKINGGIGLIASRLSIEGPLKKGKGSFFLAGRRTYIDVLSKPFIPSSSSFYGSSYFFYDFNFKASYNLNPKNIITSTMYLGIDKFKYVNKTDAFNVEIPWGNKLASLQWKHKINHKLWTTTTTYATNYEFSFGSYQTDFSIALKSSIFDLGQKIHLNYTPTENHHFIFGVDYINHSFVPSSLSAKQENTELNTGIPQTLKSHETGIFISDTYKINPKIESIIGLRYSNFLFVGPFTRYNQNSSGIKDTIQYDKNQVISFYQGIEPRISINYKLKNESSFKLGYSFNYQYIQLTSLSALSLPTDIWYPSTDKVKPQQSFQLSIGYFKNVIKKSIEFSSEIYYKGMENLAEYKPGALPSDNITDNLDNLLTFGKGRSYGIEFFLRKSTGKINGWIGYTLSKTERLFETIQNNYFPAKYDRIHDLSVVGSYKHSDRWTFGLSFVYASGNTITLPSSWYLHEQSLLFNYYSRNSTRMNAYHRLDFSATLYDKATKIIHDIETGNEIEISKKIRYNWSFSIYNIYNHNNPFFLYMDAKGYLLQGNFKLIVKQVSLFPIIPSITWNFSF
jgi:hypothetical protein